MKVRVQTHRYEAANRCIYCGKEDGHLGVEHIIPLALGGCLTIPKASCHECAKITGRFEGECCRSTFGNFRMLTGMPTRRPKQRPSEIVAHIMHQGGRRRTKTVPLNTYPRVLSLPVFAPASIATPRQHHPTTRMKMWGDAEEISAWRAQHGGIGFKVADFNEVSFCRMLAKIGHALAVAEVGVSEFATYQNFTAAFILSGKGDYLRFIGADGPSEPAIDDLLHDYQVRDVHMGNMKRLVARIRLFAFTGSPYYHVFVGEKAINQPDVAERHIPR